MSEQNNEAGQPETINKSEVLSFCRHMGRSLKGTGASDVELAHKLMGEAEYLQKNGFSKVADMFSAVAQTLDPTLPKLQDRTE